MAADTEAPDTVRIWPPGSLAIAASPALNCAAVRVRIIWSEKVTRVSFASPPRVSNTAAIAAVRSVMVNDVTWLLARTAAMPATVTPTTVMM